MKRSYRAFSLARAFSVCRFAERADLADVGSGSGYLLGILHQLVSPGGRVVGIEHVQELVDASLVSLRKDGLGPALDDGSIAVICGDGRKGSPEHGPFDAIHVGAAPPSMPEALVEQLASPGRMFIPVGSMDETQYIWQARRLSLLC